MSISSGNANSRVQGERGLARWADSRAHVISGRGVPLARGVARFIETLAGSSRFSAKLTIRRPQHKTPLGVTSRRQVSCESISDPRPNRDRSPDRHPHLKMKWALLPPATRQRSLLGRLGHGVEGSIKWN